MNIHKSKRLITRLAVALLFSSVLSAAPITYSVNPVGMDSSGQVVYRYIYDLRGVNLEANQELDIRFEVSRYQSIFNGTAPAGFDLLLFQPDAPPGVSGSFSLLALASTPVTLGLFSVDFTLRSGAEAGPQAFFINQYDSQGLFLSSISSGMTQTPEPSLSALVASIVLGLMFVAQRKRKALAKVIVPTPNG